MKTLYFDCFSGISGDMILGTLIDLGLDPGYLTRELGKLHLDDYLMKYKKKLAGSIQCSDVTVHLEQPEFADPQHQGHDHEHHPSHHHRNLADCQSIINRSQLSDWVKKRANQVFEEVARAEAKVHGKAVSDVYFHEVGAVDSIIDIVGVFIGLEKLGIEQVYASKLHDGHGFIDCAHGRLPIPVPAVAEMLASASREIPYEQGAAPTELITPTGMAIIKTIAVAFGSMPEMRVQKVGYGSGKRDTGSINALRGIIGEQKAAGDTDEVLLLETNIDDQNGEIFGYVMDSLLHGGALDVFYTPIYMKKNRPAIKLSVLAKPADKEKMLDIILSETSTIGVRIIRCPRYVMQRELLTIHTAYGDVHVKHATRGETEKWTPEFEDCAELARKHQIPLSSIYHEVNYRVHLMNSEKNTKRKN